MLELTETIENISPIPKGYRELLIEFSDKNQEDLLKGELLQFNIEDDGLTVYNPAPVVIDGQTYLWARVEKRKTETDSVVQSFKAGKNGECDVVVKAPIFKRLQDPFYCGVVDDYHIFGGNQADKIEGTTDSEYRTVFYRYKNLFNLINTDEETGEPFAVGPKKMKGIRLIQRENGRIDVFSRPQGQFGGRGRIGYFEIVSLDTLGRALAEYDVQKNPETLIQDLFIDEEWGGANQLFNLPNGKIGVLGHIAGFSHERYIAANGKEESKKNYYPMTFVFDPETRSASNVQIIATAEQFPPIEVKKSDLESICYSGGLVRLDNGYARLYVGIGDTKAGRILIKDPF